LSIHVLARTALASLIVCSVSRVALADPPDSTEPGPLPAPEVNPPPAAETAPPSTPAPSTRPNTPERGFLFAVEPTIPDTGRVVFSAGMGNVARTGEERPVGSGPVFPTLGAEVGLLSRLSVYADGGAVVIQSGNPGQLSSPFILDSGLQILLTSPTSRMWRLTLRPSYSYDVTGASTANLTATIGWYYREFRVVSSFMASHTFLDDADTVDLQGTLGATYALPYGFRVGLEGVVSDIEEVFIPGAEGGASAFAGPTAGWEWGRVQMVFGPAFGVTPGAIYDNFLFRGALSLRL
jgi:hypothetical protein